MITGLYAKIKSNMSSEVLVPTNSTDFNEQSKTSKQGLISSLSLCFFQVMFECYPKFLAVCPKFGTGGF